MDFERFFDDDLAAASYAVACKNTHRALIIDPHRDVDRYLDWASDNGHEITHVLETHIHADFISGARELAAGTGAQLLVSAAGDYENLGGLDVRRLADGDSLKVGSLRMRALHVPGHTFEHLCVSVLDDGGTDRLVFTGDFMFDGDLGRPDLLGDHVEQLARKMYRSLRKFLDSVVKDAVVWPGHGAGSPCGRSLGELPATTPGRESRAAWWADSIAHQDEAGFVEEFTSDLPTPPRYFPRMKEVNAAGPEILGVVRTAPRLTPKRFRELADDGAVVLDCRAPRAFAEGHVPGSYATYAPKMTTYAGAVVPWGRPVVLVCASEEVEVATRKLSRLGLDDVRGFVPSPGGASETASFGWLTAGETHEVWRDRHASVLDVRSESEYEEQHIPGATHVPYLEIPDRLDELERDRRWVVHCASGKRATLVASVLAANGFDDVDVFPGGPDAWRAAGHRLET